MELISNKNEIKKSRIDWIDMAKGYGIILVILGHLGVGKLGTWIYTFHMPLFFFLSGYVFSSKYDFNTFIKRKLQSIILPYFALGIPMIIFQFIWKVFYEKGNIHIMDLFLSLLVQRRFLTLWYLACLFWLNIGFYCLVKYSKSPRKNAVLSILIFLLGLTYYKFCGVVLPWNIDICFTAVLFFWGGYWLKNNYTYIRTLINKRQSIIVLFVSFVINIVFGYLGIKISGKGMEMFYSSYGFWPFSILSAFAGIVSIIIVSHWFTINYIRYIGENSLIYFAWHQTIMIPIVRTTFLLIGIKCYDFNNYGSLLVERVFELIVIISVLTIFQLIISRSKLKFMIGK